MLQEEDKRLSISLLGPPEASLRGYPLRFGIKKQLALLCYLAAEGGRRPRGELAEPGRGARSATPAGTCALSCPNSGRHWGRERAHDGEEVRRPTSSSSTATFWE